MNILGIRFRSHGPTNYYNATYVVGSETSSLTLGHLVVVDSEQGLTLGEIVHICDMAPQGMAYDSLPLLLRLANEEDTGIAHENTVLAEKAHAFCLNCIRERHLEMKLVDVEIFYDRSKIVFYFTAPARIDFRELVKDLVREYRSRIELRQIGVRHETQMIGAVGNCGMVCCCRRFLRKFAPVTIRMAKEQNLFLNPAKISGICGRLLCCLSYEQENYDAFHRTCPRLGKKYHTSRGVLKILRANMFRNTVSALNEANEELEIPLDEWQELTPRRPESPPLTTQSEQAVAYPPESDDGLLVVSATLDIVEDMALFDDDSLLDDEPLPDDGRGIFGLACRIPDTAQTDAQTVGRASRRKRRKRPHGGHST